MKSELLSIKGMPTLFVDHTQDGTCEYTIKTAVKHIVQYLSLPCVKISRNITFGSPMFIEYFSGLATRLLFVLSKEGTNFSLELCTGKLIIKPKDVCIRRSICNLNTLSPEYDIDLFNTDAIINSDGTATITNADGDIVRVNLDSTDASNQGVYGISHIHTSQVRTQRVASDLELDTVFDTKVFDTFMSLSDADAYIEAHSTRFLERIVNPRYENVLYFDNSHNQTVGILTVQSTPSSCFVYDSSLDR